MQNTINFGKICIILSIVQCKRIYNQRDTSQFIEYIMYNLFIETWRLSCCFTKSVMEKIKLLQ